MRIQHLLTAVVCLTSAAACGKSGRDLVTPDNKDVNVTVSIVGTPSFSLGTASDGYPTANCSVSLRAQASGGGSATWESATFFFFTGLDRTRTQDSAVVSALDVQSSWNNSPDISTVEEQGGWDLTDGLPFDVEIVFHYLVDASHASKATGVRFTCGPALPTGGVTPPTISQLTLAPERAQWQPGDSLGVQFEAASASGLWLTYAAVSGADSAVGLFPEYLHTTATRLFPTQIPHAANLGTRATATVFAVDQFGQEVKQSVATPPLVDVTPPEMLLGMFRHNNGSLTTIIADTCFVGDSLDFVPLADDNHALSAIVWHATSGGYGDSILVNGVRGTGDMQIRIPVPAQWSNGVQFQFYAIDESGNVSNTVTTPPNAFVLYPTTSRPMVSATVDGDITGALIDTARSVVYVLQGNQHRIGVLSLAALQQTRTIALPGYPQSLDMTPGGDSLLVVQLDGKLLAVDLRQADAVPTPIPLAAADTAHGQRAVQVQIAANGEAFVALSGPSATLYQLLELNLATGSQRIRTDAGAGVGGISRSLDQKVLAVSNGSCVERYDVSTDSFGPCVVMSRSSAVPSVDRTGQHFGIQLTAFDASLAPIDTVQSPWNVSQFWLPTSISADGAYLYYYYYPVKGFIRARVSDGALVDRTVVPGFDAFNMSISPDGTSMVLYEDDGVTYKSHLAIVDLRDADAQPLQMARVRRSLPRLTRSLIPATPAASQQAPVPAPAQLSWRAPRHSRPPAPHRGHASRN